MSIPSDDMLKRLVVGEEVQELRDWSGGMSSSDGAKELASLNAKELASLKAKEPIKLLEEFFDGLGTHYHCRRRRQDQEGMTTTTLCIRYLYA